MRKALILGQTPADEQPAAPHSREALENAMRLAGEVKERVGSSAGRACLAILHLPDRGYVAAVAYSDTDPDGQEFAESAYWFTPARWDSRRTIALG